MNISMALTDNGGIDGDSVYFLVDKSHSSFKIGMSTNTKSRVKQLGNNFDLDNSFRVIVPEGVFVIEKILHRMFRKYSISKPKSDGSTEWFDAQCFASVQDFLNTQQELLGWTHACAIPRKPIKPVVSSPAPLKPSSIRMTQREREILIENDDITNNQAAAEKFAIWVDEMLGSSLKIYRFETNTGWKIAVFGDGLNYEKHIEPMVRSCGWLNWAGGSTTVFILGSTTYEYNKVSGSGFCFISTHILRDYKDNYEFINRQESYKSFGISMIKIHQLEGIAGEQLEQAYDLSTKRVRSYIEC